MAKVKFRSFDFMFEMLFQHDKMNNLKAKCIMRFDLWSHFACESNDGHWSRWTTVTGDASRRVKFIYVNWSNCWTRTNNTHSSNSVPSIHSHTHANRITIKYSKHPKIDRIDDDQMDTCDVRMCAHVYHLADTFCLEMQADICI